ncbi:MAG: HTTM domain-containing protein, partial [Planctomycetaceae bacterium]|nr:HTTM domain-containing protein [Planctomycetaceae bacterium]
MSTDSPLRQEPRLSQRISDFFYREEVPFPLALVRIVMPLVLLSVMLPRWSRARELYSADGAPCPIAFVYGWADFLPNFSGEIVIVMHTVLLLALVASSLGWCTRLSLGISTVLYVYLNMQDSVSTMTKYSVIASHVMLLLTLSHCGAVWSVDSWLAGYRRRKNRTPGERSIDWPKFPVWPQRLIQLMIGLVYFGAAITKMHTPEFFSGDQMTYWMLSHVNFANPGGEWMSQ